MYDIRQFKPALYVLLTMGITGFALAAQAPGIWLLAMMLLMFNAWLLITNRFTPLPRFIANGITLVTFAYVLLEVLHVSGTPILVIGEFLVLLQLVKVYEQRANRDYAQLLILSLLLMVAASVSTASLVFGVLLIAYLFLSLYCCLLFHLKVEADQARALIAVPVEKLNPLTLRQDQRYLSRSMRRLTGLVSSVALSMAVLVFLFFPRGTGAGLFGQLQFRPAQTLTGFSDQVSFQNIARISQSQEIVASVELFKNDQPIEGTQQLLLRGVTLDLYTGNDDSVGSPWQWIRSRDSSVMKSAGVEEVVTLPGAPKNGDAWKQIISLRPTGTSVLFAMSGASTLEAKNHDLKLHYSLGDGTLATEVPLMVPLNYEVISRDAPVEASMVERMNEIGRAFHRERERRSTSQIDPKIAQYALKPEVSGSDDQGPLAARRARFRDSNARAEARIPTALDDTIASNIERHLRNTFSYTLDLTDAKRIKDQDPIVAFLYDLKRGHCEYFAGAMTLLCQSLGMDARMVVGFKCDEYNDLGHYYTVRQSHAHAWVEVRTPTGWKTYDPTSSREAIAAAHNTLWQRMRNVFDYLEHTWASNVVAYDRQSRENLLDKMETKMDQTAVGGSQVFSKAKQWMALDPQFWTVSSRLLSGFISLMLLGLLVAVCWFLYERWRLRRRAQRIGIETLPVSDQQRLVRQLGFYDDLIRLLERHHIQRPRHLTPLEFCNSLAHLPNEVYDAIHRLTLLFYRIRYGDAQLHASQQRRLAAVIAKVGDSLDSAASRT